ncbi:MAG: sensor histidine kinase [Acidobacteriota bacterium]|nr:sensor histidine kinase [Acidobacteriota bacterium]
MRFKTMATITALVFVAAGFGFGFAEMNLLRNFGQNFRLPNPLPQSSETRQAYLMMYFGMRSFVHLFGVMLFGCGLLAWAIRNVKDAVAQTNASLALFGLNAIAGAMTLQQFHHRKEAAGWVMAGAFFIQAVGYCWLLVMKSKDANAKLVVAAEPGAEALREQWAQQIHEAAAQAERNRLARELHDSIKQQLFSINVNAATVQARWENDETGAKTALESVRNSVREAMAEMEAMLQNLRPAPLETIGLVEALRQQCESLQYRTGANVTAEIGELPANQELPPGAQDAVFRIAQEALANIARHARAQNVKVRLHRQTHGDEDTLWLKIEDDGSGFQVSEANGMGLANIRSRVLEIGGSLQIESREGEGTSLTVNVPLAATGSREVRHELRNAFVFTLIGFSIAGFWILDHAGMYWSLAGFSFFALSGWMCFRATRSIRQMKATNSSSPKQILELQSRLRQAVAALVGALMWSLESWHITAERWHVYIPNETAILTLWPLLVAYAVFRVHQSLRIQARSLSVGEFIASLNHWWKWVSVFLAAAISFLYALPGVMAWPFLRRILVWRGYGAQLSTPSFQPLRAFWLATLILLLYWLGLSVWKLWLKQRTAKRL